MFVLGKLYDSMCKYPSVAGAWDDNLKNALGRQNVSSSTTLPLSVHYRMNYGVFGDTWSFHIQQC